MNLSPLPAFTDNYIWMLHDGRHALVIDPGEAAPVLAALERHALQLQTILITHHHADHVGGVQALRAATGAQVWGPAGESLPEPVTRVQGGDQVQALGGPWQVIDVPGHTAGHVAYYSASALAEPLVFCGDTLFSGGCGRIFEGTPAQMQQSLDALAALPDATQVCCAHEYTLSNLRFALAVEPNNAELIHYMDRCQALRAQGRPTLPSRMGLERSINPFLRTRQSAVVASAHRFDASIQPQLAHEVLAALRAWKNVFS